MLCVERVLLGSVGDEDGDPDGLPVDVGSGSVVDVVSVGSVGSVVSLVGLTVVVTVPGGSGGALATTRLTVRPCLTLPAPGVCSRIVPSSSEDSRLVSLICRPMP